MDVSDKCRVDLCDRRAAASIIRDNLPGPLPLCATHTEDFRMNGAGWIVTWDRTSAEPTSVKVAEPAAVGRGTPGVSRAPGLQNSPGRKFRSRLSAWRGSRS
jgi:hypothetical protein